MAEPVSLATLALGGANFLGGLFGKGGGAAPTVTKQDNYQHTALNISVGDFGAAVRAATPFPGAVAAGFATPVGYGARGGGSGLLDMLQQHWLLIAAGVGAVWFIKRNT